MSLSAVPDPSGANPAIPPYEGKPVAATQLKLLGIGAPIEIDDTVLEIDQVVRCYVEARITAVGHEVDDRSGNLNRVQKGRVIEIELVPWDPDDPNDRGVR